MGKTERTNLPKSQLIDWLLQLRQSAEEQHKKLCGMHRANITTLRMESFHEGRLHAINQILAQLHPGHLQHPERWTGELDKNDQCNHWTAWGCSQCNGFGKSESHGACNCHWPSELQGIPLDVYDDTSGAAPIFDVRHPAMVWEACVWKEVPSEQRRAYLERRPMTHRDLLEGLDAYRRCFGCEPTSILISYHGARCGILLCGEYREPEVNKPEDDETHVVDIPGLLRQRYKRNTSATAEELAESLSVEGLPWTPIKFNPI